MSAPPPLPYRSPEVGASNQPTFGSIAARHFAVLAVVAILLLKIVPLCTKKFADYGAELPGMTVLLIDLSNWWKDYWFVLPILPVPAYFVALYFVWLQNGGMLRLWTRAVFILTGLFLLWSTAAIALPFLALVQKLS